MQILEDGGGAGGLAGIGWIGAAGVGAGFWLVDEVRVLVRIRDELAGVRDEDEVDVVLLVRDGVLTVLVFSSFLLVRVLRVLVLVVRTEDEDGGGALGAPSVLGRTRVELTRLEEIDDSLGFRLLVVSVKDEKDGELLGSIVEDDEGNRLLVVEREKVLEPSGVLEDDDVGPSTSASEVEGSTTDSLEVEVAGRRVLVVLLTVPEVAEMEVAGEDVVLVFDSSTSEDALDGAALLELVGRPEEPVSDPGFVPEVLLEPNRVLDSEEVASSLSVSALDENENEEVRV